MLDFSARIHDYIVENREEIVNTLKELVKIPSVTGVAEPDAPFGRACADVLEYTQKLYQKNGFETELDKDGGYLLSHYGEGTKSLGLFAHADVVPVGDDWILTEPFSPVEKDGFVVGRGALDDKSAVVISLYCAKMFKELKIPFNSRLVCFTGANEESGMQDVKNYISKHTPPDFSLVADTAFPLYRGNKGMIKLTAFFDERLKFFKGFSGNNVKGSIVANAEARLYYSDKLYNELNAYCNDEVLIACENNEIIIKAQGISKHTALPEGSVNAGYHVCNLLKNCCILPDEDKKQTSFMAELLSKFYGEAIGIENTDPDFGKLTFCNDMIYVEDGKINLHFNLRFGKCVDMTELKSKIQKEFAQKGWGVSFESESPSHITDINHPMITACLDAYKSFTGDTNPIAYINAGGTYARYLPCAAEIGTTLKWGSPEGLPCGHGAVHQPDECISVEGMLEALELTMLMLLECDKNYAT